MVWSGSLGSLRRQLVAEVCPPEAGAWEELMLAQACSAIFDTAVDQIIAIVSGLEDARLVSKSIGCWLVRR